MSEDARDRILTSALSLFATDGYDAVSVERIRAHAGVSNGSFFHAFPSKVDLAVTLLGDSVASYQAFLLRRLAAASGARGGIRALVGGHLEWVERNQRRSAFMFDQARADWFARARPALQRHNEHFRGRIDAWRTAQVAAGALRPLPTEVLTATLFGPSNLLVRTWLNGIAATPPWNFRAELQRTAEIALLTEPQP